MSFPISFKGRLGADPDVTISSNGTAITKMRIVTNARRLVDGTWTDTETSWWSVTAFGKQAEAAADALHKGDLVLVMGKIKQRDWEKDGVKRTTADIIADEVAKVVKSGPVPTSGAAQTTGLDGWATEAAPF